MQDKVLYIIEKVNKRIRNTLEKVEEKRRRERKEMRG